MSWCDKLASVPGIGVRLSPHFLSSDSIIDSLSSAVLDQLTTGRNADANFSVDQITPFGINFSSNEGFTYQIDHRTFAVIFHHRVKAEQASAGPPTMKLLSKPMPYTELLPIAVDKLVQGVTALKGSAERSIVRIGVVSNTYVTRGDVPPGIDRMLAYFGRPWQAGLDHMDANIFGTIADTTQWNDRCGHRIAMPEDEEKVLTITLDYQRRFKEAPKVSEARLKQLCRNVSDDALSYFEKVAEGNMFDEELLSGRAE